MHANNIAFSFISLCIHVSWSIPNMMFASTITLSIMFFMPMGMCLSCFSYSCFFFLREHMHLLLWLSFEATQVLLLICVCMYNRWLNVQLLLWQLWVRLGKTPGLKNLSQMSLVKIGLWVKWQLLELLLHSCSRLGLPLCAHWLVWVPF